MKEINLCKPSKLSNACSAPIVYTNPASFIACEHKQSERHPKGVQRETLP